jgi:predicted CopG family antitoxin
MNQLNEIQNTKTIVISEENYQKLKRLGYTADSFNSVISRLLANVKEDRQIEIA